jgi:hypothetical protein
MAKQNGHPGAQSSRGFCRRAVAGFTEVVDSRPQKGGGFRVLHLSEAESEMRAKADMENHRPQEIVVPEFSGPGWGARFLRQNQPLANGSASCFDEPECGKLRCPNICAVGRLYHADHVPRLRTRPCQGWRRLEGSFALGRQANRDNDAFCGERDGAGRSKKDCGRSTHGPAIGRGYRGSPRTE